MTEPHLKPVFEGGSVVFYLVRADGINNAEDFLDKLPLRSRARFDRFIEKLRDGVVIRNKEQMRSLETDSLGHEQFELKVHDDGGLRLYVIQTGSQWLLIHGGKKPKKNKVNSEIGRTWEMFYEWLDAEENES